MRLCHLVARSIATSVPPNLTFATPVVFSLTDALRWTEVEMGEDPQLKRKVMKCKDDFCILVCATANVLTLHPAEERSSVTEPRLDSHRRLDLASQFLASQMTVVGLQETRLSVARAVGIGQYLIYAAAANARGQGGVELWILSSWVPKPREVLVLVASHRLLIVRVPMLVGIVQFVVAHALDTSYPPEKVQEWWNGLRSTLSSVLIPSCHTIWLIDANATVGTRQSEAIGPHHPEKETTSGGLFHDLLLDWSMALPATFHSDKAGPATWQSTSGTQKRIDFVAVPRIFLPHVQSAGVDPRIVLDINTKVDHFLTQVTVHLPPVQSVFRFRSILLLRFHREKHLSCRKWWKQ